jgi:vancomycin resistance protein YoaR
MSGLTRDHARIMSDPFQTPSRRTPGREAVILGLTVTVMAVVALAAGGLFAWDASYASRILPGVRVGSLDLGGMDRTTASAAIAAAYPYGQGRLVLRTPDGDTAITYASIGRQPDTDAMVDEAMAAGRTGSVSERAIGEIRQALDGVSIAPRARFDEPALRAAVVGALTGLAREPVDATITMTADGPATTPAQAGRTVDASTAADAAVAAVQGIDVPAEVAIPVKTADVSARRDDAAVAVARIRANRVAAPVVITWGGKLWTVPAGTVRSWVRFTDGPDGTPIPTVDTSQIAAALGPAVKAVAKPAGDAILLKGRGGKVVGVSASHDGRALDADATVGLIAAELEARGAGSPATPVPVAVAPVAPRLTTDQARQAAPLMTMLGTWTTYFPISERNFFGANIWRPAQLIDGTVLAAGRTFDWWNAIWPVTTARGFGPGGVIKSDHTDPTGALGGGMCSSSTTLFNAALRAGLQMGARSNHRYYITRYPLGLDATVSASGGSRQTMSFTNDTGHPILIRAFRIRGTGGRGYVRYQIWGVPDGRTVSLSKPSVSNVSTATTNTVTVTTLPHGVRKQVEFPANGMDVVVTRVVRNASGAVIHRDVYATHYVLWNGRIEVGA